MALLTYTASSVSPIPVYPAGQQEAILVRNTETVNHVYLSNLASGNGFDLGPGSSMIWSQGNPLYVSVTDPTKPATITILDNGGDLFDASAIAAQISISGAPPVDSPTTFAFGDSAVSDGVVYDISKYQTLFISLAATNANLITDIVGLYVYQHLDAASIIPMRSDFYSTYGKNSTIDVSIPVTGLYVTVFTTLNTFNPPPVGTANITIVGSYRSLGAHSKTFPGDAQGSSSNVVYSSAGADNGSFWSWTTLNASQNRSEFPTYKAGPVSINYRLSSPITAGTMVVTVANEVGTPMASKLLVAGDEGALQTFNVPTSALKVTVSTNATFAPTNNTLKVGLVSVP